MNKEFILEIIPQTTPLIKRKCSKCKSNSLYYCSEKFRLNAQKKNIDVWLIYKCTKCDNTCNITIFSRINAEAIDKELFLKFSNNDRETAWKYAFDLQTIKKNDIEVDYNHIEYDILHENITLEEIIKMDEEVIEFKIKSAFDTNLKLSSVLKQCFNISINELEKMYNSEIISIFPEGTIRKYRAKDGTIISIHTNKLKTYLQQILTTPRPTLQDKLVMKKQKKLPNR